MNQFLRMATRKQKFYVVLCAIVMISLYAGLADYDWYWQVELGKAVVTKFNFNAIYDLQWGTKGVDTYLDHEWLTNVIFYICSLIGTYGISLAKFLICCAYAGATCWYLKEEDKDINDTAMLGIGAYVFMMAGVFIKVKAYILSVAFLLVEVVLLKRYKKKQDAEYFIWMLLLLILWNNMHSGSMPLFFVVAGVYWATELKFNKKILAVLPVYVLGLVVNPYGYQLPVFDLTHNFDSVMKEIVLDWRAIDAKTTLGMLCAVVVLGVVFFLIGTDIKEHAFDLVMTALVLYMSFGSARHLIYLAPFFYSIVLDNKYKLKLSELALQAFALFCAGIAMLSVTQAFTSENYSVTYAADYTEPELIEAVLETNKDTSYGLYCTDISLWQYGLQHFTSGAFPCTKERTLVAYELGYSASEQRIEELIEEWELTKFLAIKYNPAISYREENGVLYDYLVAHDDEYEMMFDSDFYFYAVRKDLLK